MLQGSWRAKGETCIVKKTMSAAEVRQVTDVEMLLVYSHEDVVAFFFFTCYNYLNGLERRSSICVSTFPKLKSFAPTISLFNVFNFGNYPCSS